MIIIIFPNDHYFFLLKYICYYYTFLSSLFICHQFSCSIYIRQVYINGINCYVVWFKMF